MCENFLWYLFMFSGKNCCSFPATRDARKKCLNTCCFSCISWIYNEFCGIKRWNMVEHGSTRDFKVSNFYIFMYKWYRIINEYFLFYSPYPVKACHYLWFIFTYISSKFCPFLKIWVKISFWEKYRNCKSNVL